MVLTHLSLKKLQNKQIIAMLTVQTKWVVQCIKTDYYTNLEEEKGETKRAWGRELEWLASTRLLVGCHADQTSAFTGHWSTHSSLDLFLLCLVSLPPQLFVLIADMGSDVDCLRLPRAPGRNSSALLSSDWHRTKSKSTHWCNAPNLFNRTMFQPQTGSWSNYWHCVLQVELGR